MDVDGTLTDGKIYISKEGEIFKAFDVKDGYAIYSIIRHHNIEPVIITGRESKIVTQRCKELNINHVYQGVKDKKMVMDQLLKEQSKIDVCDYTYQNCAYIGDDIPDLECMKLISENGGIVGCPADAVSNILDVSNYICEKKAGDGAVREFIEWIIENG